MCKHMLEMPLVSASGPSCGLSPAADGLPAGPGQALRQSQCPEESLGITEEQQRDPSAGQHCPFSSQKHLCVPPSGIRASARGAGLPWGLTGGSSQCSGPGTGVTGQVLAEDVEASSCLYKVGTKTSVKGGKKNPTCISISLIKVAFFCRGWQAQSDLCN